MIMKISKNIFIIIMSLLIFSITPKAEAAFVSDAVDLAITYTAKATYYVTKYTLKSAWFITKKTAKGLKIITKSTYNATKDSFHSTPKIKNNNKIIEDDAPYYPDESLPPVPKEALPIIEY